MTQREKNIRNERLRDGRLDTYGDRRMKGDNYKAAKAADRAARSARRAARAQALDDVALLAGDMTRSAASGTKWAAVAIARGTANVTLRLAAAIGLTQPRTQLGRTLAREAPKGLRGFIARVRGGEALKAETIRQSQQRLEAAQGRREAEFAERTGLGRLRSVAPAPAEDIETMTIERPRVTEIIIRESEARRERARLRRLEREAQAGDALGKADAAEQQKRTRK